MDKRIIAFVDGSIYSASVCEHAAWAAGRLETGVEIAHVIGRREAAKSEGLGARSALQAELASLDAHRARLVDLRGDAILEDAAALVRRAGMADVATHLVHGDLLAELSVREKDADLVVIGKRGEAADFAIRHLGSNLERIARTTSKPLLVASRAFRPIRRVLLAHDGGAGALRVADHAARSPLFAGLEVTVVHVGQTTADVERRLKDAETLLRAGGIAAQTKIIPGQPEATLAKVVEDGGFDMLVMGAYGHSRLRSLLIGSTTASMIHACKVPVLLLR